MPWTPISVSAWRTSSSLNGLMIATISFMTTPLWADLSRSANAWLCEPYRQTARELSGVIALFLGCPQILRSISRGGGGRGLRAQPDQALLGDGRHVHAVAGEDHAARQAPVRAGAGVVL